MKNYEVIFADLDGTLINTISGETFPNSIPVDSAVVFKEEFKK